MELGFLSRPVCLPVLFRLWHGKGCASHVELARQLVGLLACAFAGRGLHVAADAAYHGRPLRDLPYPCDASLLASLVGDVSHQSGSSTG